MKFLADENFDRRIFRQIRRLRPDVTVVRVQDVGLIKTPDSVILEWAAEAGYIVLTHDIATLPADAYRRIADGHLMPGVVAVPWQLPIGRAVEDLLTLLGAGSEADFIDQIVFLPL